METKIYTVTDPEKDRDKITEAAEVLKNGGIVAFPTDTVYALGALMNNEDGVKRLFEVKERPKDNPMSVLVARDLDMHLVVDISAAGSQFAFRFVEEFWPGPLTIIMPKVIGRVPDVVTGGTYKVGVRNPKDDIAVALIDEAGYPVVAPSANLSGRPSPTTGQHVIDDLNGKVDMILVGPDSEIGVESTVIDLTYEHPTIVRKGSVTLEQLQEAVPARIVTAEVPGVISL